MNHLLITTTANNVVTPIHVVRSGVVMRAPSVSNLKVCVQPPINSKKLPNLTQDNEISVRIWGFQILCSRLRKFFSLLSLFSQEYG